MTARRVLLAALALGLASCTQTTAPPPSSTPAASSTATATSGGGEALRFAAVGDIGDGGTGERLVAGAIAAEDARADLDLILLLGDLIYPNGDPAQYPAKFAEPYRPVERAGIRLRAALGNHDLRTDAEALGRAFGMPARYYTFTEGPVQFFALDDATASIGVEQLAWLRRELGRSRARWQVLFMHVPAYSSGMHGSHPAVADVLRPIVEEFGVELVLAGHDHDYERTRPIGGAVWVVSGGGCCPRTFRGPAAGFTAHRATGLHFVVVEVTAAEMRLVAVDAQGRRIDRATIPRRP